MQGDADLISRCQQAKELFAPIDVMISSLEDVQPVYSAMFDIFNTATDGLIRLEVDFSHGSASGDYEIGRKRWIRLDGSNLEPGVLASSQPLDLNVVALEGFGLFRTVLRIQ